MSKQLTSSRHGPTDPASGQTSLNVPNVADLTCGMVHIASIPRSNLSSVPPVGAATRKGSKNEECLNQRERPRLPCYNQDNFVIAEFHLSPLPGPQGLEVSASELEVWRVYAVLDGHGLNPYTSLGARDGDVFADAAARVLSRLLYDSLSQPEVRMGIFSSGLPGAEVYFAAIFRSIDMALRMPRGGATLTLLVHDVKREMLHSAHVGDSLGIFLLKGDDQPPSQAPHGHQTGRRLAPRWITAVPHKPTSPAERRRLVHAGKGIFINSLGRLGPASTQMGVGLAVSRSLGDTSAEPFGKISVPDVSTWNIARDSSTLEYAVIATDGLWDVMTPGQVAQFLEHRSSMGSKTLSGVAKALVDSADVWSRAKFGLADDITVVIVDFREDARKAAPPPPSPTGRRLLGPVNLGTYGRRGLSAALRRMRDSTRTLP